MARYGNHGIRKKFSSDADVKRFFQARGLSWDDLVQTHRSQKEVIPLVENLVRSTWIVAGSGKAAFVSDPATDKEKEIASVQGPGILTTSSYLQLFEKAASDLDRCMENASFADFQSCVSSGIASIDTYIVHRAWLYNSTHPSQQLVDSKDSKVSQDDKVDEWIPQMLGGKRLDKSGINWRNFKTLRTLRDDLAIHLKSPAISVGYQQLGEWLSLFRSGIAGLLVDLHLLFAERIPCQIIRYYYLPDIRLLETPN